MSATVTELFRELQQAIAATKAAQTASQDALASHGDDLVHVSAAWDAESTANREEQSARIAYARAAEARHEG